MSKPTITKSFDYKLKYGRDSKLWSVLVNNKVVYIKRVASGRYFVNKDTVATLRDAVILVLSENGIV